MRRFALIACLGLVSVLAWSVSAPLSVKAGNTDAAHACQQAGYLTLTRSDGTGFKNAGECTSYAARGGQITGIGAACTATATTGCIVLDSVTIRAASLNPITYLSATTYTLSGTMTFTPTCQLGTAGCDYSTVTITGSGTFSASDGTSTLGTGTWVASYSSPDPYSFTDASFSSTSCASAAIQMVTARLALTWPTGSGGAWVEVRLDSSATGPTKTFVLGYFTATGLPGGFFHTADVNGVTLGC
ncbi:MAG: hypothetical protein HYX54_07585 [Chloroflexi bacterium]|nr:hypothetical protein [Chloroflexota bacterium]